MKEIIIKFVLNFIAGITAEQWKHALETVREAYNKGSLSTGEKRKAWVKAVLLSTWSKELSESTADVLRFFAVRFVNKQLSRK